MSAGWIEWNGGECPVEADVCVRARFADGGATNFAYPAPAFRWSQSDPPDPSGIIAYRIVQS